MLRLRQIALVASDLAAAEAELGALVGEDVCFRDPGVGAFGLANALFAVGDQFLEIVSPITQNTTAGRLLEKRGGDGGYMVILQTDDLPGLRQRLESEEVRIVFEANGNAVIGLHLHPKDVQGAILSVDKTDDPPAWPWAGDSWDSRKPKGHAQAITGVEIQVADPVAVAAKWSRVLGVEPPAGKVTTTIILDDAEIRFVETSDGRGDGLSGIDLVSTQPGLAGTSSMTVGTQISFR